MSRKADASSYLDKIRNCLGTLSPVDQAVSCDMYPSARYVFTLSYLSPLFSTSAVGWDPSEN